MKQKAAFIGIGVMGSPMAGHLSKSLDMAVYNRTQAKSIDWAKKYGGRLADSLESAIEGADFIFLCVGDDEDLKEVMYGTEKQKGVLYTAQKGTIIIDHTTSSPSFTQEIYKDCQKQGLYFIDAPVSGGYVGAENAKLAIMVGGDENVYTKIAPFLSLCGKPVYMGKSGFGQLTKMMNQICAASNMKGVAEAVRFAWVLKLDIAKIVSELKNRNTLARSWALHQRADWMVDTLSGYKGHRQGGFKIWLMVKDLDIVFRETSLRKSLILPVINEILGEYVSLCNEDNCSKRRWDFSNLVLFPYHPNQLSDVASLSFQQQVKFFEAICLLFTMRGIWEANELGKVFDIDRQKAFMQVIYQGAGGSWAAQHIAKWLEQEKQLPYDGALKQYERALALLEHYEINTSFLSRYNRYLHEIHFEIGTTP